MYFPIGWVIYLIEIPFKLFIYSEKQSNQLFYKKVEEMYLPIEVEYIECVNNKKADDIMFVHGWPDKGHMWDRQV